MIKTIAFVLMALVSPAYADDAPETALACYHRVAREHGDTKECDALYTAEVRKNSQYRQSSYARCVSEYLTPDLQLGIDFQVYVDRMCSWLK
jgi:hypothetical protein